MWETINFKNESSKDNIKNIDWVKWEVRKELVALRKEMESNNIIQKLVGKRWFYKENEKGWITYDMKAVKDYLAWVGKNPDKVGKVGSSGVARTTAIQIALESFGYDVGKIDGIMGNGTRNAIKQFQQKMGLKPIDGKAWPKTISAISDYINVKVRADDTIDAVWRSVRHIWRTIWKK